MIMKMVNGKSPILWPCLAEKIRSRTKVARVHIRMQCMYMYLVDSVGGNKIKKKEKKKEPPEIKLLVFRGRQWNGAYGDGGGKY